MLDIMLSLSRYTPNPRTVGYIKTFLGNNKKKIVPVLTALAAAASLALPTSSSMKKEKLFGPLQENEFWMRKGLPEPSTVAGYVANTLQALILGGTSFGQPDSTDESKSLTPDTSNIP